jgi:hypothetical protein
MIEYLDFLRNAVHSYVPFPSRPREAALFAAHDGLVPAEVADLSWMYLVRLLKKGLPDTLQ